MALSGWTSLGQSTHLAVPWFLSLQEMLFGELLAKMDMGDRRDRGSAERLGSEPQGDNCALLNVNPHRAWDRDYCGPHQKARRLPGLPARMSVEELQSPS